MGPLSLKGFLKKKKKKSWFYRFEIVQAEVHLQEGRMRILGASQTS